jgi:hypothetical protein
MSFEKFNDRCREGVVSIPGDHVSGIGDVHVFHGRKSCTKLGRLLLSHEVADSPAHEHDRDVRNHALGRSMKPVDIEDLTWAVSAFSNHEAGIPVPIEPPVALAKVPSESPGVRRSWTMGVVGSDGFRDLVNRREPDFCVLHHERADPPRSRLFHIGDDVDQHDTSCDARSEFAGHQNRSQPAKGRANQEGRSVELFNHQTEVLCKALQTVITDIRPSGVTMTTSIENKRLPATLSDTRSRFTPGVACLASAVQKDHGGFGGVSSPLAHEVETISSDKVQDHDV